MRSGTIITYFTLIRRLPWLALLILLGSCADPDTLIQSLHDISGAPLQYDDSQAEHQLRVASVAMRCSEEKSVNLARMQTLVRQIKEQAPATQLIVFGETTLGWYLHPDDPTGYQTAIAETIPGPATNSLGALADELNVFIAFGLAELHGSKLHNSQVLLDTAGTVVAVHRKHHLIQEDLDGGFTRYDPIEENVTVTDLYGIRTGMIVCADVSSVEMTRELVEADIQFLIHSLASQADPFTFDAVARQFDSWVVFANRVGMEGDIEYSGTCYIADPAGTIRTEISGEEGYVTATIGVYDE